MTQVEETQTTTAQVEAALTPKLSPAWALRLWHLPVIAAWGAFFLLISYVPLRPNDLWCHVLWGQWILSHRQLPAEDPFQRLAEGMPVVDSAWLGQVLLGAIDRVGGPEWLSNTFALVTLATWLIIWRVLYLRCQSMGASLLMVAVVWMINFSRLLTPRPENFAWLAFAVLWWLLVSDQERATGRFRWRLWLGVPLVMWFWANVHGSFLCGLTVLLAYAVGEFGSTLWRTRSLAATIRDGEVQRRLIVAEIGLVATFINPYGVDLLLNVTLFARNANLQDIVEWQPLAIGKPGGYELVASWLLATVLLRYSRKAVPLAQMLLLVVFGLAALSSTRMIGWFSLTFGISFVPLLADLVGRWTSAKAGDWAAADDQEVQRGFPLRGRSWAYSLIGLLLIWIPLSLAPISQPLLGGKPRTPERLLGDATPIALTEYLRRNPPKGPIFNPMWWGDWIVRDGPAGIAPFMTTNIHLAPAQVWRDYLRVMNVRPGWQAVLGRYAVETVVVDKKESADLERVLLRDTSLQVVYEDAQCAVFGVRKPTPQQRTVPPAKPPTEAAPAPDAAPDPAPATSP
jgi:hypothetical protein